MDVNKSNEEGKNHNPPFLTLLPHDILYCDIFSWCDAIALTRLGQSCKYFSNTYGHSWSLPLVDIAAKEACKSQYNYSGNPPRSWESWTQILGMIELQRACIKRSNRMSFENGWDSFNLVSNGKVFSGILKPIKDDYTVSPVSLLTKIRICQVSSGATHSLFLSNEGSIYSSGSNLFRQLGREVATNGINNDPKLISTTEKFSYIAAGRYHSIALTASGKIYTFGSSDYGQCGHGGRRNVSIPTKIETKEELNFVQCYGGHSNSFFLTNEGRVFGCGIYVRWSLGEVVTRPVELDTGLHRIVHVVVDHYTAYYLTLEGRVFIHIESVSDGKEKPRYFKKPKSGKVIQIFAGCELPHFLLSDGRLTTCTRLVQKFEGAVEGVATFNYFDGNRYVNVVNIIESTTKGEFLWRRVYDDNDGPLLSAYPPLMIH